MLRKLAATGLVAGAAMGAVLVATPAHAADQQFNQNLQVLPVQLCNANVAGGVLTATIPLGSPQTTQDCINGPVTYNLSSDDAYGAIPDYGYGY